MKKTYENKKYGGNVIHLGGAHHPVNDGLLVLEDQDVNRWERQVIAIGFEIKDAADKPKYLAVQNDVIEQEQGHDGNK